MTKELEAFKRIMEKYGNTNSLEGTYDDFLIIKKGMERLEILKPLCEVMETPANKIRYLKVRGVVVYTFKKKQEYDLFKEWLDND